MNVDTNPQVKRRAPKKEKVYTKMQTFLSDFTTILICNIKDMPSKDIHKMRKLLRGIDSEVLSGKLSVMTKAIGEYMEKNSKLPSHLKKESLEKLLEILANRQVCLIFTNKDVSDVTKISDQFKIEKQSKVGAISPVEITLPAGPTGMDASQVDYFQNLRIQTKVVKNQLDIINPTKILTIGQKITLSEINLMNKFNIKPFKHRIETQFVLLNGNVYDSGILSINNDSMGKALEKAIGNIAAFGLSTGISNRASAVHIVANSFKNIIGLSIGCDVKIKQFQGVVVSNVQAAPQKVPEKQETKDVKKETKDDKKKDEKKDDKKKKPEPEPEEDDGPMGLF